MVADGSFDAVGGLTSLSDAANSLTKSNPVSTTPIDHSPHSATSKTAFPIKSVPTGGKTSSTDSRHYHSISSNPTDHPRKSSTSGSQKAEMGEPTSVDKVKRSISGASSTTEVARPSKVQRMSSSSQRKAPTPPPSKPATPAKASGMDDDMTDDDDIDDHVDDDKQHDVFEVKGEPGAASSSKSSRATPIRTSSKDKLKHKEGETRRRARLRQKFSMLRQVAKCTWTDRYNILAAAVTKIQQHEDTIRQLEEQLQEARNGNNFTVSPSGSSISGRSSTSSKMLREPSKPTAMLHLSDGHCIPSITSHTMLAHVPAAYLGLDGSILDCNSEFEKLFSLTLPSSSVKREKGGSQRKSDYRAGEEVQNPTIFSLSPTESLVMLLSVLKQMNTGEIQTFATSQRMKDTHGNFKAMELMMAAVTVNHRATCLIMFAVPTVQSAAKTVSPSISKLLFDSQQQHQQQQLSNDNQQHVNANVSNNASVSDNALKSNSTNPTFQPNFNSLTGSATALDPTRQTSLSSTYPFAALNNSMPPLFNYNALASMGGVSTNNTVPNNFNPSFNPATFSNSMFTQPPQLSYQMTPSHLSGYGAFNNNNNNNTNQNNNAANSMITPSYALQQLQLMQMIAAQQQPQQQQQQQAASMYLPGFNSNGVNSGVQPSGQPTPSPPTNTNSTTQSNTSVVPASTTTTTSPANKLSSAVRPSVMPLQHVLPSKQATPGPSPAPATAASAIPTVYNPITSLSSGNSLFTSMPKADGYSQFNSTPYQLLQQQHSQSQQQQQQRYA